MSLQAYHNDPDLKSLMLKRIAETRVTGEVINAAVLRWMPEKNLFSVSGALAGTDDQVEFLRRTGIPVDLALACEATVAMATVTIANQAKEIGFDFRTDPELVHAVAEWFGAIRPGANLEPALPNFMVHFLEYVLGAECELGPYVTPALRASGEAVLANWKRELVGEKTEGKIWRAVRNSAVTASDGIEHGWSYPVAHFIETLAWPIHEAGKEFLQPFMFVMGTVVSVLQLPFHTAEDRENLLLAAQATLLLRNKSKEESEVLLEANPTMKKAVWAAADPAVMARLKDAQLRAFEGIRPRIQSILNELTALAASA